MKKILMMLLAAAIVGAGVTPTDVEAASKKKAVAAKKKAPRAAKPNRVKHVVRARSAHRIASLDDAQHLALQSSAALVLDQTTGAVLFEKNPSAILPIASITKLMTAMVVLDAKPDLTETLAISEQDVDILKGTRSRLKVGTHLVREEMLRLALMSSENRAAAALSRNYPGGREAFISAMNQKAQALGLVDTRFQDPTGLTAANVSSPRDLAKMVDAAHQYPLIREFSTTSEGEFNIAGRTQQFRNTNTLVKNPTWEIGLSKTGYINEAGKCLVMQAWLNNKPTIIVLLDSWGKMTRIGDANRIKRWVESASLAQRQSAG
jgi:D-alanyl-D-alanine endopeptidase (penicillin-binding protein 7)